MSWKFAETGPFTLDKEGRKTLQCHSRGNRRFTPFNAYLTVFGVHRSLEDHYQATKVFLNESTGELVKARDWREAKHYLKGPKRDGGGLKPFGFELPNGMPLGMDNSTRDTFPIQWYVMLWRNYLLGRPDLVLELQDYHEFEDPFRGKFPFCQADVMRQVARHGLDSLIPMYSELLASIKDYEQDQLEQAQQKERAA